MQAVVLYALPQILNIQLHSINKNIKYIIFSIKLVGR